MAGPLPPAPPIQGPPPPVMPLPPIPVLPDKPGITDREPVALAGAVQFCAVQLLAVLVGFSIVHWTDAQQGIVLSFVGSVIAVAQSFARAKAWSPASVARLMARR